MKSPRRPPLTLSDAEPTPSVEEIAPTAPPESPPERPMSERRKRKLAEEQARLAAEAEVAARVMVMPDFAESADAPPVAYEAPPTPAPVRATEPAPTGRHAYLIA